MWLFNKKTPAVKTEQVHEEGLGEEHAVMDFDRTVEVLKSMSPKAQATFLYKLVGALPQGVVRTLRLYTANRLGYGKDTDKRPEQRNTGREFPFNKVGNS